MSTVTSGARLTRYVVAGAVLAAYVGAAIALRLDANIFILLSFPITLLFQALIARRPIRALWLLDTPPVRIDWQICALFALLAAFPAYSAIDAARGQEWGSVAYNGVAVLGAAAGAYAWRAMNRGTLVYLRRCMLTAGAIGIGFVILGALLRFDLAALPQPVPFGSVRVFTISMLQYVPITFVVEEVLFRGALDAYLHETDTDEGTFSAYYVSTLWALWHLPLTLAVVGFAGVPGLVIHLFIGVPLSMAMRRGRNLAVPGLTHSVISAFRNALT